MGMCVQDRRAVEQQGSKPSRVVDLILGLKDDRCKTCEMARGMSC